MTTIREHVLDEAKKCVLRDRNLDYDIPERNFERIAAFWNTYLGDKLNEPILPHDTAVMAMLIKVSRIMQSPSKEDHWIDLAGYAAAGAECIVPPPHDKKDLEEFLDDTGVPGDRAMYVDLVDARTGEKKYRLVSTESCDSWEWKDFSGYTER